jgi:hypothetical protein
VTHGALAVGLAGLLDGQVHGGAGSRLKSGCEQARASAIWARLLGLSIPTEAWSEAARAAWGKFIL